MASWGKWDYRERNSNSRGRGHFYNNFGRQNSTNEPLVHWCIVDTCSLDDSVIHDFVDSIVDYGAKRQNWQISQPKILHCRMVDAAEKLENLVEIQPDMQLCMVTLMNRMSVDHYDMKAKAKMLKLASQNVVVDTILDFNPTITRSITAQMACKVQEKFRADETAKKSEPSGANRSGTESAKITPKSTESVESTKVLGVDYTAEHLAAVERVLKCRPSDHHEILLLPKCLATKSAVTKSFRQLAIKIHPDKNLAPGATEAFQMINRAYDALLP